MRWFRRDKATIQNPDNIVKNIQVARNMLLPNVEFLLKLLATMPVSNSEAERSFSALKRLKTYMRSEIGQSRLTGLALMHVHCEIDIDAETVIEKFCESNRRLMLKSFNRFICVPFHYLIHVCRLHNVGIFSYA